MNLHLHSRYFCTSMGWASCLARIPCTDPHAMTTAPPRGHSCFHLCHSSAKLHVSPRIFPSWDTATSFEGWPSGPPWGPWVLPGDTSSPGMDCGAACCHPPRERVAGTAGTPALGGLFSIKTATMPESPNPFFQLFFFPSLRLTVVLFFHQIIPGNSYFCKNSDIIPIRW